MTETKEKRIALASAIIAGLTIDMIIFSIGIPVFNIVILLCSLIIAANVLKGW